MPSPVGHALGGLIAGGAAAPARTGRGQLATFAVLGMLPDLDLLFGIHSMYTHSVGAMALVGMLGMLGMLAAIGRPASARFAVACALAYGSHILLDWLGNDTSAPIGIMALWPITSSFYESNLHVFHAISRRFGTDGWIVHNVWAVLRELVILGPIAAIVWVWRTRRR